MARPVGATGKLVAGHTAKVSAAQDVCLPADVAKLLGLPVAGVSKTKRFAEFDWNIGGVAKAVTMTNALITVTEFPQPQQPTLANHLFTFAYSVTTTKWRSGNQGGVRGEEFGAPGLVFYFLNSSGGVIWATPFTYAHLPGTASSFFPACVVYCGDSNQEQVQTYSSPNDPMWLSEVADIQWLDSQGIFYQC
jgi:hypothetical protein